MPDTGDDTTAAAAALEALRDCAIFTTLIVAQVLPDSGEKIHEPVLYAVLEHPRYPPTNEVPGGRVRNAVLLNCEHVLPMLAEGVTAEELIRSMDAEKSDAALYLEVGGFLVEVADLDEGELVPRDPGLVPTGAAEGLRRRIQAAVVASQKGARHA